MKTIYVILVFICIYLSGCDTKQREREAEREAEIEKIFVETYIKDRFGKEAIYERIDTCPDTNYSFRTYLVKITIDGELVKLIVTTRPRQIDPFLITAIK